MFSVTFKGFFFTRMYQLFIILGFIMTVLCHGNIYVMNFGHINSFKSLSRIENTFLN